MWSMENFKDDILCDTAVVDSWRVPGSVRLLKPRQLYKCKECTNINYGLHLIIIHWFISCKKYVSLMQGNNRGRYGGEYLYFLIIFSINLKLLKTLF